MADGCMLPPEQLATYAAIIDGILQDADLNKISAKAIRQAMQERITYDITPQKNAITAIIMERFDKAQSRNKQPSDVTSVVAPAPTTNGHHSSSHASQIARKRKADRVSEDESESSVVKDASAQKAKKSKMKAEADSDEAYAAKLQAEFNAQARSTRGAGTQSKKRGPAKREKKTKKKSSTRIGADDDSDVEGATSDDNKERKGGFHKLMNLSEPLSAMLGETALSRPRTVKKIWAYVKEHELQDPADKRQFRCDPAMRAVFKQDKVHMFTMNKLLSAHLYPQTE